ncbi:hypothetical protein CAPTEDRAFT_208835 [Capitella teleta]|uniref:VWFD domain-containing protein n=1 Tax=Capitella teleta TaxID=283909 RepID=R7UGL0_CAPTE|nr:hypothetical protein CAPTEDRAFT_208835 [Capitella teleta]|eukprot:ELU02412.1 hypothetical protein CAPTEDRAFT_208835 [Capitella teleta]
MLIECNHVSGECVCRGDPHCFPFDADRRDPDEEIFVSNVCQHILVTDRCTEGGTANFIVSANFDRVKNDASPKSFVKELNIIYEGKRASLSQGLAATYQGQPVAVPSSIDGFVFNYVAPTFTHHKDFPADTSVVLSLTTPNGAEVLYDGIKSSKVVLPRGLSSTCGLCGNNDGILDQRDLIMGPNINGQLCNGYPAGPEAFQLADDLVSFVNSWFQYRTSDAACQEVCS